MLKVDCKNLANKKVCNKFRRGGWTDEINFIERNERKK